MKAGKFLWQILQQKLLVLDTKLEFDINNSKNAIQEKENSILLKSNNELQLDHPFAVRSQNNIYVNAYRVL